MAVRQITSPVHRRIAIPAPRDARTVETLPAGIHLKPGELRIEFYGTEDLLRHLFELSQAILNDYKRFQGLVEEESKVRNAGTSDL